MNALTKPFNGLGWPALSLPAGVDRDGLPLSLQVAGLPGTDALVLRAAAALEGLLGGATALAERAPLQP
jgi:Asp-tRNA(Asn)/Glu-tRNA(Gln) amidotransferase A subunit family amidase